MKAKFITLVLGLAIVGSVFAKKDIQVFKPEIFGGDYQYQLIDSLSKGFFLPTMLYSLQKDSKHIGYALYMIGYDDYSVITDNAIYIDRESRNGMVYFLGSTKQQALQTLQKLYELTTAKKAYKTPVGDGEKSSGMYGKVFYEEHYSMLVGHEETCCRIRQTVLGLANKGLLISNDKFEPAFLSLKRIEQLTEDIQNCPEPQAYATWDGEEGNGEVRFSAPIYVAYVGSSAWKGFGGSEMYVFRRDYIKDAADTENVFPETVQKFRKYWKYTVEDPMTPQGAMLPLGDDINQAINTIDELSAGMEKQHQFFKGHKIWFMKKDKTPAGYVWIYDIPREYALNGWLTMKYESDWPQLIWTYSLDADTQGLTTNITVMNKVRKILEKEQAKKK